MTTIQLIKDWYKFAYCSTSGTSTYKAKIIAEHSCECDMCGVSIFELDDFPEVKKGEVLCEYCHRDKYMLTCPICEEYFYKANKPKDEIIIISREAIREYSLDIKPGFYQIKEWPYHYGNVVTGFEGLYPDTIALIKELDINSMLRKLFNGNKNTVWANECCHDCMKKYTGQTKLVNNYWDKEAGKKRIKLMREVIAAGK